MTSVIIWLSLFATCGGATAYAQSHCSTNTTDPDIVQFVQKRVTMESIVAVDQTSSNKVATSGAQGSSTSLELVAQHSGGEGKLYADIQFPHGKVNSLLFDLHIDDEARHFLARDLVNVFFPGCNEEKQKHMFVVVGWGGRDPVVYPKHVPSCLNVSIFEPDLLLHTDWETHDRFLFTEAEQKRIKYNAFGLGAEEAELTLEGRGQNFIGHVEMAAKHVTEHVSMLSLDTQGTEFSILQGFETVIRQFGCDVMLIEAMGTTKDLPYLLTWLDSMGYVIFDFVAIKNCEASESCPEDSRRTKFWGNMDHEWYMSAPRPSDFASWLQWFYQPVNQYKLVQTDLLAVHRTVITPDHENRLAELCLTGGYSANISSKCPLRKNWNKSSKEIRAGPKIMPECKDPDPYGCLDELGM